MTVLSNDPPGPVPAPEATGFRIDRNVPRALWSAVPGSGLSGLLVTRVGRFEQARHHFIHRHGIEEDILMLCEAGYGFIETDAGRFAAGPGDAVYCAANRPHAYGSDFRLPWTIHWAHLRGREVQDLAGRLGFSPERPVLPAARSPELYAWMREALDVLGPAPTVPGLLLASSLLRTVFCRMLLDLSAAGGGPSVPVSGSFPLEAILRQMETREGPPLSVADMAAIARLSPGRFARRFRALTGYAPADYQRRLRLRKACALLDGSDASLGEIAQLCGFPGAAHLTATFRRVMGCPPRAYRRAACDRDPADPGPGSGRALPDPLEGIRGAGPGAGSPGRAGGARPGTSSRRTRYRRR